MKVLKATEVARLFGVTPKTVRNWALKGAIPAHRTPGYSWLFREDEIAPLAEKAAA